MMSRDDWERVKELFTDAVLLPAETRGAWLAAHGGDDHALRAELASLLESHDQPHRLFAQPTIAGSAAPVEVEDDHRKPQRPQQRDIGRPGWIVRHAHGWHERVVRIAVTGRAPSPTAR